MTPSLRMQASDVPSDYDSYKFGIREIILFSAEWLVIDAGVAYVFYRSIISFFLMLPLLYFFFGIMKKKCIEKRKRELTVQFGQFLGAFDASLKAGYSVENAIINCIGEMTTLYGKNSLIYEELVRMRILLRNNRNIEDIFDDFSKRAKANEITDFAEVFRIAKRSGGDMPRIIRRTGDIISENIDTERKINTIVSEKRLEQSIMSVMPFAIILYVDFSSPGYFESLYHNISGIVVMSCLLFAYVTAVLMAGKILNIKV